MFSSRRWPAWERAALRSASRASSARLAARRERSMGRCGHTAPASACARRLRRSRCWSRCTWTSAAGRNFCRGECDSPSLVQRTCRLCCGVTLRPERACRGTAAPGGTCRQAEGCRPGACRAPPRFAKVSADHVTLAYKPSWADVAGRWAALLGAGVEVAVLGLVADDGVQVGGSYVSAVPRAPRALDATVLLHVESGGGAEWRRHCTDCSPWCEGV